MPETFPVQPIELTRHRLWYLYCFAGFDPEEIAKLTGRKPSQIRTALRKWKLGHDHIEHAGLYISMRLERDPEAFFQELNLPSEEWDSVGIRPEFKIQKLVRNGHITWQHIDDFRRGFVEEEPAQY